MAKYTYIARNSEGSIKKGELTAPNEKTLAKILRQQGLLLTHAEKEVKKKKLASRELGGLFSRITTKDKIVFTRNLQVMIKAGLPISKALDILIKQTQKKGFKNVIFNVTENVKKGKPLADSMALHPNVFPPLFVNMIRIGETGGELEKVLGQLSDQMKKDSELMSNIRSAMIYPVIILSLMVVVVVMMIIFVLPQLVEVFRDIQADLPLATRFLIGFSDFTSKYILYLIAGFVLICVLFYMLVLRTKEGRAKFHAFLLRIPVLGINIKKINLARFSRTTSTLLTSGIPIIKTLDITSDVLGNISYQKAIKDAAQKIKKGIKLVEILEEKKQLFPPLITQMIAVGEETGSLDHILKDVADFYETDVTRTTKDLASIIEPILMITLGVGVAIMAVAIVAPIYSLMDKF